MYEHKSESFVCVYFPHASTIPNSYFSKEYSLKGKRKTLKPKRLPKVSTFHSGSLFLLGLGGTVSNLTNLVKVSHKCEIK